jgi:hypothetical protein
MLTAVTTNDAGNYSVVVANLAGSVISSNAMLSIVPQFNVSPVLKNTTSLGAFFNITWSSIPGEIYLVEYKNSLTQNNWYILGGPNVATNTTATAYDIISPDSPTRFYRLWLLATNAANTQPPATIVSSPTASEQWTNAMLTVNGTSSDVSAVAAVFYKLNTGPWTAATTTNAWANWSASVTLIPGTNTFLSYAVDTSGNFSTTNTVAFVWEADYAFDYVGTYGNPVTITYTNQSQQIVQASGFPGQVQLFVTTNTPPLTVQTFAQLNGGFVIAQIPLVGY